MKSNEILNSILPDKSPYERTLYLLYNYRDMKRGKEINEEPRNVMWLLERAVDAVSDDRYIDIIHMVMEGGKAEEIANKKMMDLKSIYKQRRRLIKRISVVLYGDEAL